MKSLENKKYFYMVSIDTMNEYDKIHEEIIC